MTPDVYGEWNKITNVKITDDGQWVMYQLSKEEGDKILKIYDKEQDKTVSFDRVKKASFDQGGGYAFFTVSHPYEAVRDLKRKKVKKKDMPKDTLCVYDLKRQTMDTFPNVQSFKNPKDWADYIAFQLEPDAVQDTIRTPIKESKDNGSKLVLRRLSTKTNDTLYYSKDYTFAEKGQGLVVTSKGAEDVLEAGVYAYDFDQSKWSALLESKGDVSKMNWSEDAAHLTFILDADTTENRIRPYELYYWKKGDAKAQVIADQNSDFLPAAYNISNFSRPRFSDDGNRLIFTIAPPPVLQDTALLEDEIVNVEVWHYDESELYTRQENNLKSAKERDFECIYFLDDRSIAVIGNEKYDRLLYGEGYDDRYVVAQHDATYDKERMWLGHGYFDGYRIDVRSGTTEEFVTRARGRMARSPEGRFVFWYDASVQGHWIYDVEKNSLFQATSKEVGSFGDEKNDRPMDPYSYGYQGFSKDEKFFIVYDRYDIWLVDTSNENPPRKVTNGRADRKVHRIVDMEYDEKTTDISVPLIVHIFDEIDKSEAYASYDLISGEMKVLYEGAQQVDQYPTKARKSDDIITTIEDYNTFPNLVLTDPTFGSMKTISNANPQQEDYLWGEIKLHSWTSETGQKLDGLLVLPEGFDPSKKYPLIVNFYERSSDGLHRHRAPYAHRSTINYTYYSSKGYILFNPDVVYRIGYPGQSCYESVIPGVQSLIDLGFIDEDRIGVQGHSWGGYQIADLLTKTDMFRCAEAGAPVVNMVSAYGGIRWGSGLSRMFQYEKTQSRLGATLWERPDLYLENSPIFKMDKVSTPVLILHNDEDGAVPWYQGIEYFTALRRLGKPAWFLNYNNEPHWPVKWPNRLDFNRRMEQFFDHFLMDAPMPRWMKEGVPPIQKGIDQGLDNKE